MMLTKQELIELKKQGKTIFRIYNYDCKKIIQYLRNTYAMRKVQYLIGNMYYELTKPLYTIFRKVLTK
jgi:uncharacterized protein YggT (Ycf19 family)